MTKIKKIEGLEILDSRGQPTLCVTVSTTDGTTESFMVPSGASTGKHEALELRDHDPSWYSGKGVKKALHHVCDIIAPALVGKNIFDQALIDQQMIAADGTENKSRLGANAILAVSMAVARTAASTQKKPLYEYLAALIGKKAELLPVPMINVLNGGAHADNDIDIQEFMIRPSPIAFSSFAAALEGSVKVFHTLKQILKSQGEVTAVGDEGGFAPRLPSAEKAIEVILEAIERAGYQPGKEFSIALDLAASEFFIDKHYCEKKKAAKQQPAQRLSSQEQIAYCQALLNRYPIDTLEDALAQEDWDHWAQLTKLVGKKTQIVGDDIFVTNPLFLRQGIEKKTANAILVKINQIGTLTETLEVIDMAQKNNYGVVISHRSGETEDNSIADLAVATNAGQIKTGSLSRSERISKYNRLLTIEAALQSKGRFGLR